MSPEMNGTMETTIFNASAGSVTGQKTGSGTQHLVFAGQTVVSILTVIFNLLLVIVLVQLKSAHLNFSTRYFLISGATSQSFIGLMLLVREVLPCIIFGIISLYMAAMTSSSLFLSTVDSYVTIIRPYTYKFILTPQVTKTAILGFGLAWALFVLLTCTIPSSVVSPMSNSCTVNDGNLSPLALVILCGAILFILLLSTILSIWNILHLRKTSSKIDFQLKRSKPVFVLNGSGNTATSWTAPPSKAKTTGRNKSTRQGRLIRLLTASLLVTVLCWPQLLVATLLAAVYDMYGFNRSGIDNIRLKTASLIAVDGFLHPIIAVILSSEIRNAVKLLVLCKRKVSPQSQ